MPDKPWKRLERRVAKIFGGERVKRMGDWAQRDTDVKIRGLGTLKIDCKLRARHKIHSVYREVNEKYREGKNDRTVIVTRENGLPLTLVTVELGFFAELLKLYRALGSGKLLKVVYESSNGASKELVFEAGGGLEELIKRI
ncbi:MAG: hypothetical protein ACREB3_00680 [Burkholderiales bacterium]